MTYKEAKHYIIMSVKEGYMSEEEAKHIEALPKKEMIRICEELGSRGDDYANQGLKQCD